MKSRRLTPIAAALLFLAGGALFAQDDPLAWLNAARRAAGVPAVAPDMLLSETAQAWAERLAEAGVLTHRGDDGSTGLDRYRALGGTEVRVGEILGAGREAEAIEAGWLASAEHRRTARDPAWTHAGWGRARSGAELVMVMMFTIKRVEGLSIQEGTDGVSIGGRFGPGEARGCRLYNGLDEVQPVTWDPVGRQFLFLLPATGVEGYLRLGYVSADGAFTLTNAWLRSPTASRPAR